MQKRSHKAQSLIEVVTGCLVMVPIALLAVDVAFVLGASRSNSDLAMAAARLAGNQTDEQNAVMTVRQTLADYVKPSDVLDVKLNNFNYDDIRKLVTVTTFMEFQLPVPLPGYATASLTASSVQPIVGVPAPR